TSGETSVSTRGACAKAAPEVSSRKVMNVFMVGTSIFRRVTFILEAGIASSSRRLPPLLNPAVNLLLQQPQRHAAGFQDPGVELADVESSAQCFLRPRAQFANLQLPDLV